MGGEGGRRGWRVGERGKDNGEEGERKEEGRRKRKSQRKERECYREYHYSRLLSNSRATPTNYNGYTSMVSLYLENPSHSGS